MEATFVTQAWPVQGPCSLEPIRGGINSKIWRVHSPSGDYILRQYRATADVAKVRYELEVLRQLGAMPLSFAVAVPIPTRAGDVLSVREGAVLTLVRAISGANPDRVSTSHAAVVGEALGELVQALARVAVAPPASVKDYGHTAEIHPAVPDPAAALLALPLAPGQAERMARLLEAQQAPVLQVYAGGVPQQQIHGDWVYANLLMENGRITGVLDFEFTCPDLRAMDLASALSGWTMTGAKGLAPGQEWELIEAFGQGYALRQPLTPAEIDALPLMIGLRRSAIYANLTGLYLVGSAPVETSLYAVESALQVEDWLAVNGAELQRRARGWGLKP